MYNYKEAVKQDIEDYIEQNYNESDFEEMDSDDIAEKLENELWIADSVTGNGSGSYTFNRWKAEQYVKSNLSLCLEACTEFGLDSQSMVEKMQNEEWEWFDVSIRCYLLSECLLEVIESIYEK